MFKVFKPPTDKEVINNVVLLELLKKLMSIIALYMYKNTDTVFNYSKYNTPKLC